MRFSRPVSVVSGALVLVGATTLAYAAAPDSDAVIRACYANADAPKQNLVQVLLGNGGATYNKGDLRFVADGEECKQHETPVQWDASSDQVTDELAALADKVGGLEQQVASQADEIAYNREMVDLSLEEMRLIVDSVASIDFETEPRAKDGVDWYLPQLSGTLLAPGATVWIHYTIQGNQRRDAFGTASADGKEIVLDRPQDEPTTFCEYTDVSFSSVPRYGDSVRTPVIPKGPGCP